MRQLLFLIPLFFSSPDNLYHITSYHITPSRIMTALHSNSNSKCLILINFAILIEKIKKFVHQYINYLPIFKKLLNFKQCVLQFKLCTVRKNKKD